VALLGFIVVSELRSNARHRWWIIWYRWYCAYGGYLTPPEDLLEASHSALRFSLSLWWGLPLVCIHCCNVTP